MIALFLIVCLGASPAPASSEPAPAGPEASSPREVAREVSELLEAGKVNEAFARIDAANEVDPDPRYLFMRASLEEQLGRCSVAVPLYREFYLQAEVPMDREEARAGLTRCDADPPAEPGPTPAPVPKPKIATVPSPEPVPRPPSKTWQRDPWGWALLGSGAAVTAAGGTLLALGRSAARETRTVELQTGHADARRRSARLQPAGIALIATGSALWVAGVVRMAVADRRHRASDRLSGGLDGFSIFF